MYSDLFFDFMLFLLFFFFFFFSSMLLSLCVFILLFFFLWLISSFIPVWSEKILEIISVLLIRRDLFCGIHNVSSILDSVPCALEKNVYGGRLMSCPVDTN